MANTSQSIAVLNISGGTFAGTAGGIALGSYNSTGAYTAIADATLNISGTAAVTIGNRGLQFGPDSSNGIGWNGTVNLDGGTLTTNRFRQRGAASVTTPR